MLNYNIRCYQLNKWYNANFINHIKLNEGQKVFPYLYILLRVQQIVPKFDTP